MKLLKWIAAFFALLAITFGVLTAKEIKSLGISPTAGLTAAQLMESAPETAQKVSTYTLVAFVCVVLCALVVMAMIVSNIRDDFMLYKSEQRVYGRDISGYKAVFGFKITAALLFLVGAVLVLYGGYKTGKDIPSVPLAENKFCTKRIANVLYTEDGTPYYSFKADNGTVYTKNLEGIEKYFVSRKKEINVRYLTNDPSQNSVDYPGSYMPEDKNYVAMVYIGVLSGLLSLLALVVAVVMGRYNVYSNRKRGYTRRFDKIDNSAQLFENYDDK